MAVGDYNLPPDFDLEGPWGQGHPDIDEIAAEMGWTDWTDIIAAEGAYDEMNIRPGEYFSAEDAILEAYERGILDFCEIWFDGEAWHLIVDGDSGGTT